MHKSNIVANSTLHQSGKRRLHQQGIKCVTVDPVNPSFHQHHFMFNQESKADLILTVVDLQSIWKVGERPIRRHDGRRCIKYLGSFRASQCNVISNRRVEFHVRQYTVLINSILP